MTGQIVHQPTTPHLCEPGTPSLELPTGTVWKCDQCGDEWTLIPPASLTVDRTPCPEWWLRGMPDPGIVEGGARWYDWALLAPFILALVGVAVGLVFS